MRKEQMQEFTARVTQGNRTQLVVTIYDIILVSLQDSREAWNAENMEEWRHSLERAQALVMELVGALDFQYGIANELLPLYLFVNRRILHALARRRMELLDGVDQVIRNLRNAFEEVAKTDRSAPVMANTQKVYAGLTYGRTSDLSEMYQDTSNRGFKA
ncbi:MAG: flagellar protein FliS [Lachnospiraceae bacterium]|nr:flagellar protein FliS [Lachnospiraceae bacterium]